MEKLSNIKVITMLLAQTARARVKQEKTPSVIHLEKGFERFSKAIKEDLKPKNK